MATAVLAPPSLESSTSSTPTSAPVMDDHVDNHPAVESNAPSVISILKTTFERRSVTKSQLHAKSAAADDALPSPSRRQSPVLGSPPPDPLLKFADVLYKCTLCTSLPSILTSADSFVSHVRRVHVTQDEDVTQSAHLPSTPSDSTTVEPLTAAKNSCGFCSLKFVTPADLQNHVDVKHSGECSRLHLSKESSVDFADTETSPLTDDSAEDLRCRRDASSPCVDVKTEPVDARSESTERRNDFVEAPTNISSSPFESNSIPDLINRLASSRSMIPDFNDRRSFGVDASVLASSMPPTSNASPLFEASKGRIKDLGTYDRQAPVSSQPSSHLGVAALSPPIPGFNIQPRMYGPTIKTPFSNVSSQQTRPRGHHHPLSTSADKPAVKGRHFPDKDGYYHCKLCNWRTKLDLAFEGHLKSDTHKSEERFSSALLQIQGGGGAVGVSPKTVAVPGLTTGNPLLSRHFQQQQQQQHVQPASSAPLINGTYPACNALSSIQASLLSRAPPGNSLNGNLHNNNNVSAISSSVGYFASSSSKSFSLAPSRPVETTMVSTTEKTPTPPPVSYGEKHDISLEDGEFLCRRCNCRSKSILTFSVPCMGGQFRHRSGATFSSPDGAAGSATGSSSKTSGALCSTIVHGGPRSSDRKSANAGSGAIQPGIIAQGSVSDRRSEKSSVFYRSNESEVRDIAFRPSASASPTKTPSTVGSAYDQKRLADVFAMGAFQKRGLSANPFSSLSVDPFEPDDQPLNLKHTGGENSASGVNPNSSAPKSPTLEETGRTRKIALVLSDLLVESIEGCVSMETLLTLYDLRINSGDDDDFYKTLKDALPIVKDEKFANHVRSLSADPSLVRSLERVVRRLFPSARIVRSDPTIVFGVALRPPLGDLAPLLHVPRRPPPPSSPPLEGSSQLHRRRPLQRSSPVEADATGASATDAVDSEGVVSPSSTSRSPAAPRHPAPPSPPSNSLVGDAAPLVGLSSSSSGLLTTGENKDASANVFNLHCQTTVSKIMEHLGELVMADAEGMVSRDDLLQQLAGLMGGEASTVSDAVTQWGPHCNKAIRLVFPHVSMQRKGKFKTTCYYGISFSPRVKELVPESKYASPAGSRPGRPPGAASSSASTGSSMAGGLSVKRSAAAGENGPATPPGKSMRLTDLDGDSVSVSPPSEAASAAGSASEVASASASASESASGAGSPMSSLMREFVDIVTSLVVANPSVAVPRDQILEAASIRFGSDEFLGWGSYCNKVIRRAFPSVQVERKGMYKKTMYFGLQWGSPDLFATPESELSSVTPSSYSAGPLPSHPRNQIPFPPFMKTEINAFGAAGVGLPADSTPSPPQLSTGGALASSSAFLPRAPSPVVDHNERSSSPLPNTRRLDYKPKSLPGSEPFVTEEDAEVRDAENVEPAETTSLFRRQLRPTPQTLPPPQQQHHHSRRKPSTVLHLLSAKQTPPPLNAAAHRRYGVEESMEEREEEEDGMISWPSSDEDEDEERSKRKKERKRKVEGEEEANAAE